MPEKPAAGDPPVETPPPDEVPLDPKPSETPPAKGKRTPEEIEAENERLKVDVQRANRESAGRRKKLEEYERKEKELQDADLTASAKAEKARIAAEKERDELKEALHTERLDGAIEREAAAMGFEYPDDVPRLVDRSGIEVVEGKVKGLKKALTDLAELRPKLIKEDRRSKDGEKTKTPTSTAPPRREMNSGAPPDAGTDADIERSALVSKGRYTPF